MTTIRDPQTDVSTADYTIGGKWDHDQKLTYNSSLAFTNDRDIPDRGYVDSRVVGAVNENNIYYVGNHGNDVGNDGRNIEEAYLTIQKGIDESNLQSPSITDQYTVKINDGAAYDSFTLVSSPYVHLDAPSAQLQSTSSPFVIGSLNTLIFDKATYNTGSGILITKGGSAEAYLTANELFGSSTTIALEVTLGTLYAKVSYINILTTNTAVHTRNGAVINLNAQDINGKIILDSTSSGTIITHNQNGNIVVEANSSLTMTINGEFTGNVNAATGSRVRLLVGKRTAGYHDAHHPNADVQIDYIGHSLTTHKNLLVGGDYAVNPRQDNPGGGIVGVLDDTYIADNTVYLASSASVSNIAYGVNRNLGIVSNITGHQFGILIPVENADVTLVVNDVVSMSFRAGWVGTGNVYDLRAAVIAWDGAADSFLTDVVATWAPTPTLISNWTYENIPVDLDMSGINTYHTHKIENIPVDTVASKNIAVFIWTPYVQTATGDALEISNVRCNQGINAEDFAPRLFEEELRLCQRYYSKSYDVATIPGSIDATGSQSVNKGASGATPYIGMNVRLPTQMTKIPTITPYSTSTGLADKIYVEGIGDAGAVEARVAKSGGQIVENFPSSGTFFASYHWVADGRF